MLSLTRGFVDEVLLNRQKPKVVEIFHKSSLLIKLSLSKGSTKEGNLYMELIK